MEQLIEIHREWLNRIQVITYGDDHGRVWTRFADQRRVTLWCEGVQIAGGRGKHATEL